jgi:hypothetical protein
LIDYLLFNVPFKNISLIWRRHHADEGLQNLGLCSALGTFEQGGIFIVPHPLRHGASVFPVSSEEPPKKRRPKTFAQPAKMSKAPQRTKLDCVHRKAQKVKSILKEYMVVTAF